jgi:Predicted metal-binding, possibly nucleic acid-binding protein
MKIDIVRIPAEGLEVNDKIEPGVLDLERIDLKFISPVSVNAKLQKIVNVVSADVKIGARVFSICSRCLKEEEKDFSKEFKFNYEVRSDDRFIDLEPDIREEIILSYPLKLLCSPDCKGICFRCGKDLNLGPCDCKK